MIVDWGKADSDQEAMRDALGITGENNIHPASILTVGYPKPPIGTLKSLTVTSINGGTTSPLPGVQEYEKASSVKVTAIPDPGYSFDYWLLYSEKRTDSEPLVFRF